MEDSTEAPTPLIELPTELRAPPATEPAVATVPAMAPETALERVLVIHSVAILSKVV
jgi:hypothetical protein